MDTILIINMNFNVLMKAHPEVPRLSKEWMEYRMNIFMKYTCNSLINQTNQNFSAVIQYDELSENDINELLLKYPKLPNNIIFTTNTRKWIKENIKDYKYLYLVRLDCDDMYHPTFIQQLIDIKYYDGLECIINQEGYIYDTINDRLGIWYHESPPFYTLVYKVEDYLNKKFYRLNHGHAGAIQLKHIILNNRNYVVTAHGENTLTHFERRFNRERIEDEDLKNDILREFKII